jgi:antitoxin CptB
MKHGWAFSISRWLCGPALAALGRDDSGESESHDIRLMPRYITSARHVRAFGVGAEMTGTTRSSSGLDPRRRRLLFRSWRRGTREIDLILGRFADAEIDRLTASELDDFERLMDVPEPDLYHWIATGEAPPAPYDSAVFRRLCAFHRGDA